jgi:hypothetical protein
MMEKNGLVLFQENLMYSKLGLFSIAILVIVMFSLYIVPVMQEELFARGLRVFVYNGTGSVCVRYGDISLPCKDAASNLTGLEFEFDDGVVKPEDPFWVCNDDPIGQCITHYNGPEKEPEKVYLGQNIRDASRDKPDYDAILEKTGKDGVFMQMFTIVIDKCISYHILPPEICNQTDTKNELEIMCSRLEEHDAVADAAC